MPVVKNWAENAVYLPYISIYLLLNAIHVFCGPEEWQLVCWPACIHTCPDMATWRPTRYSALLEITDSQQLDINFLTTGSQEWQSMCKSCDLTFKPRTRGSGCFTRKAIAWCWEWMNCGGGEWEKWVVLPAWMCVQVSFTSFKAEGTLNN